MRKLTNNEIIGLTYVGGSVSVGLIGLVYTFSWTFFFQLFFGFTAICTLGIIALTIGFQQEVRDIEREKERDSRMQKRLDILRQAKAILSENRIHDHELEDKVKKAEEQLSGEVRTYADDYDDEQKREI